ncbi:MAG: DNA polymerase III subunit delta [Rhodobiaceae bacterium]|nr:DNA polymerase III subunit delta [Rhodobiaceae bacterium]MCC0055451.1 DNA polymerase III subunit delta [Rhodobiaceae bacterium]
MVAIKGQDIDRFLKAPDRAAVLLYGPDAGLVSERADLLSRYFAGSENSGFAVDRLEGDEIAGDPARLADELGGAGLFAEKKVIRLRLGSRNVLAQIEAAVENGLEYGWLIIEAGDLKPSSPVRRLAERHAAMAALPAYADTAQTLARLIDEEMRAAGLELDRDARAMLTGLLGADRRASRNELQKLALYGEGKGRITVDDVMAITADAAALETDSIADNVGTGDIAGVEHDIRQAIAEDRAPQQLVGAIGRHFARLIEARGAIDRGMTAESAMKRLRPPVFFKREPAFRRQLTLWTLGDLQTAVARIRERDLEVRQKPALAEALLRALALELALRARRQAGSARG